MKKLLAIVTLALSTSTQANSFKSIPDTLACYGERNIFGSSTSVVPSAYKNIQLINLNKEPTWDEASGRIVIEPHDDKIKIDFTDGDQYSAFIFRAEDLQALSKDKLKSIIGMYEDGYDWSDGYHTRIAIVVQCRKNQ